MPQFVGIYGFEVTRPFQAAGVSIEPCFSDYKEARKRADDPEQFLLTAVATVPDGTAHELAFDLSAALTFCQARWVIVTRPYRPQPKDTLEKFKSDLPDTLDVPMHRQSTGRLVMADTFAPASRSQFLGLCLAKLRDHAFNEETGFRPAFFRCVEVWRMDPAYIDVTFYLQFSAVEILARTIEGDGAFAVLATRLLHDRFGFDVEQDNPARRINSMQTYAHMRNALFHKGLFEAEVPDGQGKIVLKLADFDDYWVRLVPDVLLKVLGFDDGHINWNRWLDRMAF